MSYLFWLDLEMTGLQADTDRILEVALIVTNTKLEEVKSYHSLVFQAADVLQNMNPWCQEHHGKSGLIEAIAKEGRPENEIENDLVTIFKQYTRNGRDKAILAGNSIDQDRRFVQKWMPHLFELLHYRVLDVSSLKIVFEKILKKKSFKKQKHHRALDDIQESMAELQHYMKYLRGD
jgi:oligoribonuclease